MYKILIPLCAALSLTATQIHAQVPVNISLPSPVKPKFEPTNAEFPCNNAGTYQLGTFTGMSNDTDLDTIFLCFNDQIQIDHNGDADLSGDPNPGTAPGIVWGFYTCPPTIAGDNLQTVLTDPCILPGAANGIWVAKGTPQGDITFTNNGNLQNAFNMGQPLQLFFSPMTVDNWAVEGYEPPQPGFPPGPCVNVNIQDTLSVVYLNAITESGVSTNFGDDCIGKFRLRGGYPEFNPNATYTVDISLVLDPTVKATIYTAQTQFFHSSDIKFSVPQPGVYSVTVEDGKSCGHSFLINMAACNPVDNVVFDFPDLQAEPGSQICVPLALENFSDVVGTSFSISWDTSVLRYLSWQNAHPTIDAQFNASNLNENQTAAGFLGVIFFDQNLVGVAIPDGDSFFELCFDVIGDLGECSPLEITNFPSQVSMENIMGEDLPITSDTGSVCVAEFPLSFNVSVIDTTCLGTAAIRVVPMGGNAPYLVIWRTIPSGATNNDIVNNSGGVYITEQLPNGTYEVLAIDNNGFGDTITTIVTLNIPILGASLNLTQLPTCNGLCDGTITAVPFVGGTAVNPPAGPDFAFNWTANAPTPGAQVQTMVCAGNYSVTVSQISTGCSAIASGTLGQPTAVDNGIITVVNASCSGINDGSITYNAENGTSSSGFYNFEWTFSPDGVVPPVFLNSGFANPYFLTGLAGGFYNVTITDDNGCTFTDQVEITNIKDVELDLAAFQNVSCAGLSDGAITVTVTETPAQPSPFYTFFWFGGGTQNDTPTSSTLSDLLPGSYNVFAVDAAGCSDTASFVITAPPPLVVNAVTVNNPTCQGLTDGSVTVMAAGGNGTPYTYIWDNALPGPTRTNLSPGTYCVTASDQNGCVDSICVNLQLPPPPAITSIDSVSVACGNDGCLTVNAPTAVIFEWTLLDGTPAGNTPQICDLPGDTFVILVTDANGCTNIDTVALADKEGMFISDTTFIEPSCFGFADGSIAIGVMGGTPNYTYQWSVPAAPTPVLFDIENGNYTVTVTDANFCTLVATFTLTEPLPIVASSSNVQGTSCAENCDGTATWIVNFASGNYIFSWEDFGVDSVRTDLCAGFNRVTITDQNNCFRIDSVFIGSPPPVTAALTADSVTCNGGTDGTITAVPAGGNGTPYTYLWSGGLGTNPTLSNLMAGNYTVTVTDNNGCTGEASIAVDEPSPITVLQDFGDSGPITCFGDSTGILAVIASGGSGTYSYAWLKDDVIPVGTTRIVTGLSSGAYSAVVTDSEGCTGSANFIPLNDPPPVLGALLPFEPLTCFGDQTTIFIDSISGGAGAPYQYSVDFGVFLDPSFPINIDGGIHFISYIDRDGCEYTDTINIFEPEQINVIFDPVLIEIELGDSLYLQPQITGGAVDVLEWTPTEGLLPADTLNPRVYIFESQTYQLTVWDENGCSGTGTVRIRIDPNRNVYIPNVFIPGNPRGLNDHFNVFVGKGVEQVNYMQVYDRWGELVYNRENFYPDGDNFAEGWDGRFKGDFVNPGVYVYIIEVKFLDGRELLYRGDVTVLR